MLARIGCQSTVLGRYLRAFSVHRNIGNRMKSRAGKRRRISPDKESGDGKESFSHLSTFNPSHSNKRKPIIDLGAQFELHADPTIQKIGSRRSSSFDQERDSLLPSSFGKKNVSSGRSKSKLEKINSSSKVEVKKCKEVLNMHEPFDICLSESREGITLEAPLQRKEGEKQSEADQSIENSGKILRPGMVLLKNYITLDEQGSIIKTCRELGLGKGGFYRPGYKDGSKLRLHMMCLGRDWDPQTRSYGKTRQHDNAEAVPIPHEFSKLVSKALDDSHKLIKRQLEMCNPEEVIPLITPDVCIVNFYTVGGRLGLHQDRDESPESLHKGLPVISFSVGNTAEFLYGDERDVQKAEKVLLESGDVLIFGGKSRHIFHGVTSIIPNTAPVLPEGIKPLRPGRLNLTFRQNEL
ncbi:unnamed protein product [Cuscuta epithymum]|uniref:Fe2OG dioxygenase domain-containing protein n=1 Tax=Cuscuta epithymum TaxID=186058 RepID=A0AAV0C826_9ASTE|nr:unnamed protein product [Cuscuta epithymum]